MEFFVSFLLLSAVEQPDVVFSVEQTRCGRSPEAEPGSPPQDRGTFDTCDSDRDGSTRAEDGGSIPGGAADLFFKLRETPEELLQLAPEAGDAIVPLTGETFRFN